MDSRVPFGGRLLGLVAALVITPGLWANQPPRIVDIGLDPVPAEGGATLRVACFAVDPEGQPLTYAWSTADGTLTGRTDQAAVDWTLPAGEGLRAISVVVTDAQGGVARADRLVPVGPIREFQEFGEALRQPVRAALGPAGDLWVTDAARQRVVHFSAAGNLLGEIGTAPRPLGIAVLDATTLLVGEDSLDRVARYSTDGALLGALGVGEGAVAMPNAIAVAPGGTIHVADSVAAVVRTFAGDGTPGPTYGAGMLEFPVDLAIAPGGAEIFVADQSAAPVKVFDASGALLRTIGSRGAGPGQFLRPQGVALDEAGRLLVLDAFQSTIQLLEPNGQHVATFGHMGDWRGAMRTPLGFAAIPGERIYVTSSGTADLEVFAHWAWLRTGFPWQGEGLVLF